MKSSPSLFGILIGLHLTWNFEVYGIGSMRYFQWNRIIVDQTELDQIIQASIII